MTINPLSLMSGDDPFRMTDAAEYLEKLATNEFERSPPLCIDRCLPAPGPAVGPGLSGSFAGGQVLEADPLTMKLSFLLCVFLAPVCCEPPTSWTNVFLVRKVDSSIWDVLLSYLG